MLPSGEPVELIDLPGAYSLNADSADEAVTRDVILGHLAGAIAAEQPGQDLAPRQIAGAAKDHQVERIDGYDARNHGLS